MVVRNKYKSYFRNNEYYLSSGENEPRKNSGLQYGIWTHDL